MFDRFSTRFGLLAAALTASLASASTADAQCPSCGAGGCESPSCGTCPNAYVHWAEGPPRVKFKRASPRPVCDPCNLEHYGYYQTCWCPWPFPPDTRHCPCLNNHPSLPFLVEPEPPADPRGAPPPSTEPRAPTSTPPVVRAGWQIRDR
jgi:hypothetical protein